MVRLRAANQGRLSLITIAVIAAALVLGQQITDKFSDVCNTPEAA
jgi:Flp pilus assembly pilin Flp